MTTMGSSSNSSSSNSLDLAPSALSKIEKFASVNGDVLFGYVEQYLIANNTNNNDEIDDSDSPAVSFGDFLDAGTGSHSLRWVASIIHRDRLLLAAKQSKKAQSNNGQQSSSTTTAAAAPRVTMNSYTAITADESMRRRVHDEATELNITNYGDIIIGNWEDTALLAGNMYDTIIADYLIGAMDGFAPYYQDVIFERLIQHLRPGGCLFVIGLQPIPDSQQGGDGDVFCRITKVRDACILLANHRCYREYPLEWITRQINRIPTLHVTSTQKFPINYTYETMVRQINVGRSKLSYFGSKGLAKEMGGLLDELEKESYTVTKRQKDGKVTIGFDYIVVAERSRNHK
jgi:hypothetical protein